MELLIYCNRCCVDKVNGRLPGIDVNRYVMENEIG